MKVDTVMVVGEDRMEVTSWYAVGKGEIKSVMRFQDSETVKVLKSFTPGPRKD